jgi:acetyl esterase/lipase
MGLIRQNAKAWGIDPQRIGVLGFSAGGHLSAALSNNYEKRTYPAVDAADELNCRPDFTVLVYPAYLTGEGGEDKVAPELPITEKTPPTFIVITQDDPVRVENAYAYSLALKKAKVPVELHIYPDGGHGYGLRKTEKRVTTWPDRVSDWLHDSQWLEKR